MLSYLLVDIGSSSVKCYSFDGEKIVLLLTKSISLKDGFNPETGISEGNEELLFSVLKTVKSDYPDSELYVYGTAIFRKMSPLALEKFNRQLLEQTTLTLTVISPEEENEYLELALLGKYTVDQPVLLINIGGGSTELVVVQNEETLDRQNIDLGVGSVNSQFPGINESYSSVSIDEVKKFVMRHLPTLTKVNRHPRPDRGSIDSRLRGNDVKEGEAIKVAFYTGGEINYMKLAGYVLGRNNLFEDQDHPFTITLSNFRNRNKQIFEVVTIQALEALMPENPKWMHGARACSAFAEAICEEYGIETIIPSDSNLMHGVVRKHFMR
jgi:hypothetical protein